MASKTAVDSDVTQAQAIHRQLEGQPSSQPVCMQASRHRPLNAAFIGTGNFVSGNHLPNMAKSALWRVHGVCDIDSEALGRAARQYEPAVVTQRYEELLANPDIDALVLGIRHHDHVKFIQQGAKAGKHMLVEKPMSMNAQQSLQIIEAVQNANVKLMVGFNRRFAPMTAKAKQIFKAHHADKPAMITIRAVDDRQYWPDWPFDINDGGGKILCECCHFFDLLSWFLEAEPVRIFCEGYREDENIVTIRFDDGSVASIISGGSGSLAGGKERIEVFCDSTTLIVEQNLQLLTNGYPALGDFSCPMLRDPYPQIGQNMTPVNAYRAKMVHWEACGIDENDHQRRAYYQSVPATNFGHFNEIEAFARAILDGTSSPVDEIDGARATACCLAAIRSMEQGHVAVQLKPQDYWLDRKSRTQTKTVKPDAG